MNVHEPILAGSVLSLKRAWYSLWLGGLLASLSGGYPAQAQELESDFIQPPDSVHIANPVLPGVADAGVLHFNGEYYIGGVFTDGSFYKSADLLNWEGPFHVFSMDNDWTSGASAHDSQIHASDLHYLNGTFHHYWSVNYWGKDQHVVHIGHATSDEVLGPYKEPVQDTWLDNRIDPHLFRDVDGKLYLYMVKFTDGNTIWVRPMQDPGTFSGDPYYLFSSLPGTWETRDNRVAEGPWVIRYRGQYYLMYNANHTSTAWGNYALGVAQASGPLEFSQSSKYPHPVVQSNQVPLEDTSRDLLRTDSQRLFSYAVDFPGENWTQSRFDDSGWETGRAGFGSTVIQNSSSRPIGTSWTTDSIWVRKSFDVKEGGPGNLSLRVHHDGPTKIYLNGTPVYQSQQRNYLQWNLDEKARALIKTGPNLLAVESQAGARSAFLDVSLFDMKNTKADDILFSPGQPNIVRGPNGFEWWLVYMANKNAEPRGQYINRIHFFDKKLTVDGITAEHTPGHHPIPAPATFSALFTGADTSGNASGMDGNWLVKTGEWSIGGGEFQQTSRATASAFPRAQAARNYRFETGLRIASANPADWAASGAQAGIFAWKQDEANWLKIIIDPKARQWRWVYCQEGDSQSVAHSLPDDFNYQVYHQLTVNKNAGSFRILLDGLPAPGESLIRFPKLDAPGLPGLFSRGTRASFDGVSYTIGWDEYDEQITGWTTDSTWLASPAGFGPTGAKSPDAVFKGDLLEQYEFSLQVDQVEGEAGIYAIHVDAENFVKAVFDYESRQLVVSGETNGKSLETHRISLEQKQPVYADMRYSDFIEKHFTWDAPTWIDAIEVSRIPHEEPNAVIPALYRRMDIFYEQDGNWYALQDAEEVPSAFPDSDRLAFEPKKITALKLVNKNPADHRFYTYKLWANELFRESNNLRVSRLANKVLFHVNGSLVFQMKADFSASRVGLTASHPATRFNGITLFSLRP